MQTMSAIPDVAGVRAKVVARFARSLGDDTLARNLDVLLWNWTLLACERDRIPRYWTDKRLRYRYTTKALSLDFNIRHPRNPALRDAIVSKKLPLRRFLAMTPQEMFPELWKDSYERVARKQLRRMAATMDAATAPDGAYQCSKCKSRKTVYSSVQIRAADEPMTNFVTCLACGKNWKD